MIQNRKPFRPAVVVLAALVLFGCASLGKEKDVRVSEEAVVGFLASACRSSKAYVAIAAERIRDAAPDAEIQRHAIQWRLAVIARVRQVRGMPDARAGLLELWTISHQMLETMEGEFGQDFFKDQQPIAVRASEEVVSLVDEMARQVLGEKRFEEILPKVKDYASEHSIELTAEQGQVSPSGILVGGGEAVGWVLSLPMKPFELGEGVGETAHSIQNVALVADRAVDVVDDMPEEMKLQMDLLLLDLERVGTINSVVEDLNRVTTSIEGFERTAATLPADVRKEVTAVLDEIDTKQADLQKTLDHAQGLVAETNTVVRGAKEAIEDVNRAVVDAKKTAESLEPVLANLTAAGQAWEATANAVISLIETANGPKGDKPAPKEARPAPKDDQPAPKDDQPTPGAAPVEPGKKDTRIVDIGDSAEKLTATAVELRGLTENIQEIIASDDLTKRLQDVDGLAAGTVDHITWRAIQLFVAFFGLMFAYKLAAMKFLRPGA